MLFITEKPNTKRVLEKHVQARVLAAQGHLLETKTPDELDPARYAKWSLEALPILIQGDIPRKIGKDRSGKSHGPRVQEIVTAIKAASCVVIACDPGREGSLIGWELLEWAKYQGPVKRLLLGATDDESVKKALATMQADPRSGDKDYCAAKEAGGRLFDDWHKGMNGTPAMSLGLKPPALQGFWSYGGVQMPTLALLYDRDIAIESFVPRTFYKVAMTVRLATGAAAGATVQLIHSPADRIFEQQIAEAIRVAATSWSGRLAVSKKESRRGPAKLYNLNSLQRKCGKTFGWRPDHTERVADELYNAGCATYPRTEVDILKPIEAASAPAILAAIAKSMPELRELARGAAAAPVIRKGSTYKEIEAEHYAYVPTVQGLVPGLSTDAQALFQLISKAYLAHHMPDAVYDVTTITAAVGVAVRPVEFRTKGTILREPGWRVVYGAEAQQEEDPSGKGNDDEEALGKLPPVAHGDGGASVPPAKLVAGQTEPPARITVSELPEKMARLIDLVEDPALKQALFNPANPDFPKGLGAAASRKDVVSKLLKRGYVIEMAGPNGRAVKDPPLKVSEVGRMVILALRSAYPRDANPVARAVTEADLALIGNASSRAEADRLYEQFCATTRREVAALVSAIIAHGPVAMTDQAVAAAQPVRPPTDKMKAAVKAIAERKKISVPREALNNFDACRAFLDQHQEPRGEGEDGEGGRGAGQPSDAQLRFAQSVADAAGVPLPQGLSSKDLSAFIDAHKSKMGALPPTANQLQFARDLAGRLGVTLPADVETSSDACSKFINANKPSGGKSSSSFKGRRPTPSFAKRR